jgi:hypothetical protein
VALFSLSLSTTGGDNFGEATLDVSYITGIGSGVPTIVSNTNDSFSTEEGMDTPTMQFLDIFGYE